MKTSELRRARASKETLYSSFRNKGHLFESFLRSHIRPIDPGVSLELARSAGPYGQLAQYILTVTTRPDWLVMMRIAIAEAPRFPELTTIMSNFLNRDQLIDSLKLWRKRGLMEFKDAVEVPSMFDALIDSGWMSRSLFGLIAEVRDDRISNHTYFVARMFLKAVAPSRCSPNRNRMRRAKKSLQG